MDTIIYNAKNNKSFRDVINKYRYENKLNSETNDRLKKLLFVYYQNPSLYMRYEYVTLEGFIIHNLDGKGNLDNYNLLLINIILSIILFLLFIIVFSYLLSFNYVEYEYLKSTKDQDMRNN